MLLMIFKSGCEFEYGAGYLNAHALEISLVTADRGRGSPSNTGAQSEQTASKDAYMF